MDKFYSPNWLARELCEPFIFSDNVSVFDPTMGAGALLHAAQSTAPASRLMLSGCDTDANMVHRIGTAEPEWLVGRSDIYSASSRRSSPVWRAAKSGVDVIVMNPPFSYRGRQKKYVTFRDSTYAATPAVAALAIVLDQLSIAQGVGIILPEGSFYGQTDESIWSAIRSRFDVTIIRKLPRGSFPDAKASSILLSISARKGCGESLPSTVHIDRRTVDQSSTAACRCVEVVRGRVHNSRGDSYGKEGVTFVHTSDLRDGHVTGPRRYRASSLATTGPLLLIPRVGRFYEDKLAISDAKSLVLSDCVFALRAPSHDQLERLRTALLHPSTGLQNTYVGTGAPHVTLKSIMSTISLLGFTPSHVPASASDFQCRCLRLP